MTNFEGLKNLLNLFKMNHIPKKHWLDFASWGIIKLMNQVLL
jgi:hypothetical protein